MNDCEMEDFLRCAESNTDPRPLYDPAEVREAAGRLSPYDELKARCDG